MTKSHSLEVKVKAVLQAARPDVLAEDVAQELGIHTYSLYRWKKDLRDAGLLSDMPTDDEKRDLQSMAKELARLRKQNAKLEMENAVLKKLKELGAARRKKPSKSSKPSKNDSQ